MTTSVPGYRAYPTTPVTPLQRGAVNEVLQSIGQAPVSTLDSSNPDVAIAWNTLVSSSRDIQAEGWTFNREYHVQLTRDENNKLLVPANYIQIDLTNDPSNLNHDAVIRTDATGQRYLYDRFQHSDNWYYNPYVDVILKFDWEDIPIPIANYVIARAAAITSSRITGDTTQYKMLQEREDYCRAQAMEYETSQGDYNFLGIDRSDNMYQPFSPVDMLRRF